VKIQLVRGDDQTVKIITRNSEKAGFSAQLTIRRTPNSPKAELTASATVEADGTITFPLAASATALLPDGRLVADVQITSPDGIVTTVIPWGAKTLNPAIPVVVAADVTWEGR